MYYIFISDSNICIFHNYAPRLTLAELTADMPCSEETFTAVPKGNCFESACIEELRHSPALPRILALLVNEELGEDSRSQLSKLTTLQLFIIIQGKFLIDNLQQVSIIL
jgi:hypothetical protein